MAVAIPEELRNLFQEPALAHVSYLNKKGQIVTLALPAGQRRLKVVQVVTVHDLAAGTPE